MDTFSRFSRARVSRTAAPGRTTVDRTAGTTLIELVAFMAILATLIIPILISTLTMTRAAAESDLIATISERNRTMVSRIQMDFNDSITGTSIISNGGLTLTFTMAGTFNGAGPDAGSVIRYSIQDSSDDPDNGADDNGNGVPDEKILVRSNQTTGEQVTVGSMIRDDASGFVANGDGITFTITTMGSNKGTPPRIVYVSKTADVYPFN